MNVRLFGAGLLLCTSVLFSSCEVTPIGGLEKDANGNVIYKGSDPACYEFPLNAAEGDYTASENGVTIKIDNVQDKNVVFSLLPGASVASYRVDVYPKAILYNILLEYGLVDASAEKVEDQMIELLTAAGGSAGYIFSADDANLPDYADHQFDWMNSNYAQYKLVPDCEYFITVVGCYDKEGVNPASLSISHFKTTMKDCVGTPEIGIDVQIGYRTYMIQFHPNSDCKYFYDWNYVTEEIDEYIDTFGDTMMRDFMRCAVTAARDASDSEQLYSRVAFDAPDASVSYTAVAIALDANQMPASEITRVDFSLKEAPKDAAIPEAVMSVNPDRIAATVVWLEATLKANCMSLYYNVVSKSEAEALLAADASVRESYARNLVANDGYGIANRNYTFDPETEQPTGYSYTTKNEEFIPDLTPMGEYAIVYVGKNFFGQLSELTVSDIFTTDALVTDRPDDCLCNDDFIFEMRNPTRTGWTFHAEYDWNEMALYRWQIVAPAEYASDKVPYIDDNNIGSREDWMDFFFGMDGYGSPNSNVWWPLPSGIEDFSYYGYDSGIEYVIAYCAEDMNGVAGPVKFTKVTTREIKPGPNPAMEIQTSISADGRTLTCNFIANDDTKQIKYYASTEASYQELGLHKLLNDPRGEYEYADYVRIWTNYAIELGLQTTNITAVAEYDVDPESDSFFLVGAISIGEDGGIDCYSPFAYKLYYKGEFHDLSDYRTAPAK